MNFDRCALTGYALFAGDIKSTVGTFIEYETDYVGRVKIPISTYGQLINGRHENYLLAGICKQRTIDNQEPIMLDTAFITEGYKNTNPASQFEEKCVHLLKHIYENYGKENREFEFNSTKDFALAYASPEEFVRIINQLKQDHFISVRKDIDWLGAHGYTWE